VLPVKLYDLVPSSARGLLDCRGSLCVEEEGFWMFRFLFFCFHDLSGPNLGSLVHGLVVSSFFSVLVAWRVVPQIGRLSFATISFF